TVWRRPHGRKARPPPRRPGGGTVVCEVMHCERGEISEKRHRHGKLISLLSLISLVPRHRLRLAALNPPCLPAGYTLVSSSSSRRMDYLPGINLTVRVMNRQPGLVPTGPHHPTAARPGGRDPELPGQRRGLHVDRHSAAGRTRPRSSGKPP